MGFDLTLMTQCSASRRLLGLFAAISFVVIACRAPAFAQTCDNWTTFGAWRGVNGNVNAICRWTDDRIVVAGSFSLAGHIIDADNIAIYRSGEVWTSLAGGVNGVVNALLALPNGDLIVGGSFTKAGATLAKNIARFDAASGTWAALGDGTVSAVNSLLLLPGGDIVVGGVFLRAGNVDVNCVARYSLTANAWSAMGGGVGGILPGVNALALLPDAQIVAGGTFTTAGGQPIKYLASYSPQTGLWSALGTGVNASVNAVVLHPSGDLYVGGTFGLAGGKAVKRIAIFNQAASSWSALANELNLFGATYVRSLCVCPNGNVGIGGLFQGPGDSLALYNPTTGALIGSGSIGTVNKIVAVVCAMTDNSICFGGTFTTPEEHVGRFSPGGSASIRLGNGLGGVVSSLLSLPDARIVVGGLFSSASDLPASNVVMYDVRSRSWKALGDGFDGLVRCLIRRPDNTLIAGGSFIHSGSTQVNGIARFDWSTSQWMPLGSGLTDPQSAADYGAYAMCLLPDGSLAVCGSFRAAGGLPAQQVAVYNFQTGSWNSLGTGIGGFVRSIAATPDGSLYVGGGTPLARFDPGTGQWSSAAVFTSEYFTPSVNRLITLSNGDLVVGGSFNSVEGVPVRGLARLHLADGSWSQLITDMPSGGSGAFTLRPNGDLIIGAYIVCHISTDTYTLIPGGMSSDAVAELSFDGYRSLVASGNFQAPIWSALAEYFFDGVGVLTVSIPAPLCRLQTARFAIDFNAADAPTLQWQIEAAQDQFADLHDGAVPNVGVVSGSNTKALSISDLHPGAAARYRCVLTNDCGSVHATTLPLPLCLSDLNCDGVSDLSDYFDFFNAWDITDISADIDGDGQVDLLDYFAFFNAFDAQC